MMCMSFQRSSRNYSAKDTTFQKVTALVFGSRMFPLSDGAPAVRTDVVF
jgi:hypothetical protein